MKKFLLTVAAYFLILGTLVGILNFAYISLDTADSYDIARFDTMPEQIQVCNLGSSHGRRALDYSGLDTISGFNFAFTAQSLDYDYRLLTHYQDRLAPGCLVIIPVSYFSFFGKDETQLADFASKNERYYNILPRGLIKEYDFLTYLCTVPFPAVGAGTDMFKVLQGGSSGAEEDITLITADTIDVAQNARNAYQRHLGAQRRDESGDLLLLEGEVQALYDIIGLCREIGAVPVLLTTPYLAEYTDLVTENAPDFLPYFYSILEQVSQDTGTPYYDYAFDPRFRDAYSLFMDADHLNQAGARYFTELFLEELRN